MIRASIRVHTTALYVRTPKFNRSGLGGFYWGQPHRETISIKYNIVGHARVYSYTRRANKI